MSKKSSQKFKYLENESSFKDEINFRGLLMKQITQTFLEVESPTLRSLLLFQYMFSRS